MEKESVFDELEMLRKRGKQSTLTENPYNDYGDRIERFKEENGELSDHQKEISLDYFIWDYLGSVKMFKSAYDFLRNEGDSSSRKFDWFLNEAEHFYRRALTDIKRANKICPEPYNILLSRQRGFVFEEMDDFKKKLHLVKECPHFYRIIDLDSFKKNAIEKSDYEKAFKLQKRIGQIFDNSISEQGLDYQKDIKNVYKGKRRFWK